VNKILLSGSKGFLGSKFDHSKYTGFKFFFAKDYKELRKLCKKKKFEFLIHFGSSNRSTSKAEEVILKNIISFEEIIKLKSFKKLLFISTDGVTKLINKKKIYNISPYVISKFLIEKVIEQNYKKYKFEFAILRLNTVISFGSKKKNLFYYLEKNNKFNLLIPNEIDYNLMTQEQVNYIIFNIVNNWENYKNKVSRVMSNETLDSNKLLKILKKLKINYMITKKKTKNKIEKIIKLKNKNIMENLLYEIKKKKKKN
tara:strand:- start:1879 stop:2646 length:768 start_codon:yes stop_codon:yes gene_type:complete